MSLLDEFNHHKHVTVMRGWIKRRTERGAVATADAIWERIQFNWPSLSEDQAERVFQDCAGSPTGRNHSSSPAMQNLPGTLASKLERLMS